VTVSKEAKANKMIFVGVIIAIAGLAGAIVLAFVGKGKYNQQVNTRDRLDVKIQEIEASGIEEKEREYNAARASADSVIEFHNSTYRNNEKFNEVLKLIEAKTVANTSVDELSSDKNNLVMKVAVTSKEEAAKIILQYQGIPYFERGNVAAIKEDISQTTGLPVVSFTLSEKYVEQYFDQDINGDGRIDLTSDDKNGDGVIDKLDLYGDANFDGVTDIRDIIVAENNIRAELRAKIEFDINNDGNVDADDDINKDGFIDDIDRQFYARIEYLNLEGIGDFNNDGTIDMLDAVDYLTMLDEIAAAAEMEGMQ
jgi:hypothetical protein